MFTAPPRAEATAAPTGLAVIETTDAPAVKAKTVTVFTAIFRKFTHDFISSPSLLRRRSTQLSDRATNG